MTVYTSGEWHVKAGQEGEFVRVWRGFGGMDFAEAGTGTGAVLLRDKEDPLHFRSFGHWPDEEAIAKWQASQGFVRWMDDLRETVDRLDSSVLDVVESVGSNPEVLVGSVHSTMR